MFREELERVDINAIEEELSDQDLVIGQEETIGLSYGAALHTDSEYWV